MFEMSGYGSYMISLVLLIASMILAFYAQIKVKRTYKIYSRVQNRRGITGAQAAQMILDANGMRLPIKGVGGVLSDHYDPRDKSLNLSEGIGNETTIAAVSVAAHEVGHAIQDAKGYSFFRARSALVPVTNLVSGASWPLIIIGIILLGTEHMGIGSLMINLGIIFFAVVVLFHLVTLPVELDASKRALVQLTELGILDLGEERGAKKMLSAAALTYIAALAVALANLLRLIIIARD